MDICKSRNNLDMLVLDVLVITKLEWVISCLISVYFLKYRPLESTLKSAPAVSVLWSSCCNI